MRWRPSKERVFGSVYFADDEVVKVDGVELFIGLFQSDGLTCQRVEDEDRVAVEADHSAGVDLARFEVSRIFGLAKPLRTSGRLEDIGGRCMSIPSCGRSVL